ncbi:tripartite tricarboxylate transporter TctB family protein [Desulfocurvus sp. DL9XJH121]
MLNSDLLVGSGSLILAAIAYFVTRDLSRLGGVFVNFTLWAMVILGVLEVLKGFIKPERITFFESKGERDNIIIGLCILGGYLVLLPLVGFLPSSLLAFVVMNLYLSDVKLSQKEIFKSVALAVVIVAAFYLVFSQVLEVPLPKGMLFAE